MPAPDAPHRSWVPAARQRLVGARIAVGSDLHLLEMALAERAKLIEALKDITDCYGVGATPEKFVEHVHDFMMAGRAALALVRGDNDA